MPGRRSSLQTTAAGCVPRYLELNIFSELYKSPFVNIYTGTQRILSLYFVIQPNMYVVVIIIGKPYFLQYIDSWDPLGA